MRQAASTTWIRSPPRPSSSATLRRRSIRTSSTALILRSARSARLEGWVQARCVVRDASASRSLLTMREVADAPAARNPAARLYSAVGLPDQGHALGAAVAHPRRSGRSVLSSGQAPGGRIRVHRPLLLRRPQQARGVCLASHLFDRISLCEKGVHFFANAPELTNECLLQSSSPP